VAGPRIPFQLDSLDLVVIGASDPCGMDGYSGSGFVYYLRYSVLGVMNRIELISYSTDFLVQIFLAILYGELNVYITTQY